MPRRGFRARECDCPSMPRRFSSSLHALARDKLLLPKGSILPFACRILDSIRGDGPKLVELSRGDIPALRAAYPGLDLVPLVYYAPAAAPRPTAAAPSAVAIPAPAANVIRSASSMRQPTKASPERRSQHLPTLRHAMERRFIPLPTAGLSLGCWVPDRWRWTVLRLPAAGRLLGPFQIQLFADRWFDYRAAADRHDQI